MSGKYFARCKLVTMIKENTGEFEAILNIVNSESCVNEKWEAVSKSVHVLALDFIDEGESKNTIP